MPITATIRRNLSNLPGWRTKRKLVVFESDDWGSVRMSSEEAFEKLKSEGVHPADDDEYRYLRNDGLASEKDLSELFEVLSSFKDCKGRPPAFTAFSLVANPDFTAIKANEYSEYRYEPFTETLSRYPDHANSFKLWKEGRDQGLFLPEFHGREHLNISTWMKALRTGNADTIKAFEHGVSGITPRNAINHISYQAAFNYYDLEEIEVLRNVIREGLELFNRIHGFKAQVFVPTNGWFNNSLERTLKEGGVGIIGASKIQKEPQGGGEIKKRYHFVGNTNAHDQVYLTRNSVFEPSSNQTSDWVGSCMKDLSIAFRWRKPAVISTHRVNYIGFMNPENRVNGLKQLKALLQQITSTWPEVEFISSAELGSIIKEGKA